MLNPAYIVSLTVNALRTMSDLAACVGGNTANIYAYKDAPPTSSSLSRAIYEMISPSVMVAWMGSGPVESEGMGIFGHEISIFVRADDDITGGQAPTFANIVTTIINGIPVGKSQTFVNTQFIPELDVMHIPTIRRIHDEEGTIDLFEIATRFDETVADTANCTNF